MRRGLALYGCARATRSRWSARGEGATSEGEFWEALNAACLERLPVLFLMEDNGYAISVPIEAQTAGGSISKLVAGFPGPAPAGSGRHRFPGVLSRHAGGRAQWCREGRGPALVHAHVIAPLFALAFRR